MRITLELSDELGPGPDYTPGPPGQPLQGTITAHPAMSLNPTDDAPVIEQCAAALVRLAMAYGADIEAAP